jgi:hypothetical protein
MQEMIAAGNPTRIFDALAEELDISKLNVVANRILGVRATFRCERL